MDNQLCFVCGSTIHPKYLLPIEDLKVLWECDTVDEEETQFEVKTETDPAKARNEKSAHFSSYQNNKFRKIQNTLFNFILKVHPSISSEDAVTEIPAKLCDKCETDIYHVCETNLEIQKLQSDLAKLSNSILDSAISSVIKHCFSENNSENYRKQACEIEGHDIKVLNKILPIDSIGGKVYKKWKTRFCKAFHAKVKMETTISAFETDIEHYEEVIYTSLPDSGEVKLGGEHNEGECNKDKELCSQSQREGSSDLIIGVNGSTDDSSPKCNYAENPQELNSSNKLIPKKRTRLLGTELKPRSSLKKCRPKLTKAKMPGTSKKIVAEDPMHNKYQCTECGQLCKRETRLKEHLEIYHSQEIRESGMYQCPECLTCFIRYQHLEFHLSCFHEDIECGFEWCKLCKVMIRKTVDHVCKKFCKKCPVCEKDFNSINSYRLHRKEVCLVKRHGDRGSKYFNCDMCSKSFNRKQGLIYHKKTHTGEKNFTCGACDKMFTSKNQLQVHERIHSGEKPYVCDLCGLTFSSNSSLVSHKKTHLGVKPYKCDTCSKSFRSLGHLNTHQIIHTGEKPFSCTICQKSFNRKENLRSHEYTHATNKPHKCSICPSTSFARASLLQNHMNSRHSKKAPVPVKSSSSLIEIKSKAQQPPHIVLTRVGDYKEMKNQFRIIKGNDHTVIPFSGQGQGTKLPEPTKHVAYLVAGNPGKYIVLKNVSASQIGVTPQDPLQSD